MVSNQEQHADAKIPAAVSPMAAPLQGAAGEGSTVNSNGSKERACWPFRSAVVAFLWVQAGRRCYQRWVYQFY